jgi:hypothetical protein
MIALICAIVIPVLVGAGWMVKLMWNARQHEQGLKEVRAGLEHTGPQQWQAIANECQTYWEAAHAAGTAGAQQPPLPPSLAGLRPIYWDVHEDRLYLSWTGGFDDTVLALDYDPTPGKRTLWLVGAEGDRGERVVWSEVHPPPENRDAR